MPRYLLHHHHEPNECGVVFASFRGTRARFATCRRSPPAAPAATRSGGRSRARPQEDALALLPFYVAERTTATSVSEVEIP